MVFLSTMVVSILSLFAFSVTYLPVVSAKQPAVVVNPNPPVVQPPIVVTPEPPPKPSSQKLVVGLYELPSGYFQDYHHEIPPNPENKYVGGSQRTYQDSRGFFEGVYSYHFAIHVYEDAAWASERHHKIAAERDEGLKPISSPLIGEESYVFFREFRSEEYPEIASHLYIVHFRVGYVRAGVGVVGLDYLVDLDDAVKAARQQETKIKSLIENGTY